MRSFTIDRLTIERLEAWREARGLASLSEALRQMVDLAHRRRLAIAKESRKRVQTSAHGGDVVDG